MIEKARYSEIAPEIVATLGEAPIDMIENYARLVAQDFCTRTNVLTRETTVDVWEHIPDYEFSIDDGEQVVRILSVEKREPCGVRRTYTKLPIDDYEYKYPDTVVLHNIPAHNVKSGLRIRYSVAPTITSCEVDKRLFTEFSAAMISGTLSKMYQMTAMPWGGIQTAEFHRRIYDDEVNRAGLRRVMNYQAKQITIKPGRFV